MPDSDAFKVHVLEWLRTKQPEAVAVETIEASGTDWAGDTEHGFHSSFRLYITWRDASGQPHDDDVEGEAMEALWAWVVGGWGNGA